jgi:hypothetical protein
MQSQTAMWLGTELSLSRGNLVFTLVAGNAPGVVRPARLACLHPEHEGRQSEGRTAHRRGCNADMKMVLVLNAGCASAYCLRGRVAVRPWRLQECRPAIINCNFYKATRIANLLHLPKGCPHPATIPTASSTGLRHRWTPSFIAAGWPCRPSNN